VTGVFITFEGGDGAGKTTQLQLLVSWLEEHGHSYVLTREPGGTDVGVELREIILHRKGFLAPRAEALLYAADRAHHVHTVVRPALERGDVVVQDRFFDSSVAYQGAGRVLSETEVRDLSLWAVENLRPNLTIVLDVPADVARARRDSTRDVYDRLEAEADDFHERVREAYRRLADEEPERIVIIDGQLPAEQIHQQVIDRVGKLLG
jgi:thymidylate kinase